MTRLKYLAIPMAGMVSMTTLLLPMQLVATMLIVLITLYGTADNEALVTVVLTSVEPGLTVTTYVTGAPSPFLGDCHCTVSIILS